LMHSAPELWQRLMQTLTDSIIFYLQLQIASGIQAVQLFDSWAGILSGGDYKEFVLPYSRQIFKALAGAQTEGALVPRIHFGTNTAAFLEDFAAVDCEVIGIDWRLALSAAWPRIGAGKAIQGNLDPAILLCDFDIIKKQVDRIFAELPRRQGFIFNLGHGVLPETPYENLIKLTEYVQSK